MKNICIFLIGFCAGWLIFVITGFTYIRTGQNQNNQIKYNITGKYIREGQMSTGKIKYNIDGNYIREGQMSTGRIIYNITNN